jgi:hypothetical protein
MPRPRRLIWLRMPRTQPAIGFKHPGSMGCTNSSAGQQQHDNTVLPAVCLPIRSACHACAAMSPTHLLLPPHPHPRCRSFEKYVTAIYWSISTLATVGYGDIIPGNSVEKVVSMVGMALGVTVFAYFMTSMTALLETPREAQVGRAAGGCYQTVAAGGMVLQTAAACRWQQQQQQQQQHAASLTPWHSMALERLSRGLL